MARSAAKSGTAPAQPGPAISKFIIPSSGEILLTRQPDLMVVAEVCNLLLEGFSDHEQIMTGPDEMAKDAMSEFISNGLSTWFARYCVVIVPGSEQWKRGVQQVIARCKAQQQPIPKGRVLVGAIVLLALLPTDLDRKSFLAHMSALSGLIKFMPIEGRARATVLAASGEAAQMIPA